MSYKKEQDTFDKKKWYDSIQMGADRCGTYEFCGGCKKDEPYPCVRALHRHEKGYIRLAVFRARA